METTSHSLLTTEKQEHKPLLVARNLSKIYQYGSIKKLAIKDINLQVHSGDLISIIGPSGSGKSTLLFLLGGLDNPSAGEILFNGNRIDDLSDKKLSEYRLHSIGFIFQFDNLSTNLTVAQNIAVPLVMASSSRSDTKKRVEELLEHFDIVDKRDSFPHQLSGGELQRVSVAVAISNKPAIILADEPTGELDTVNTRKIMEIFKELNEKENMTIILVTHNPVVAGISKVIYQIVDGHLSPITDIGNSPYMKI
ncbi:MAG: ABC transporter ATP-binding protein [Candidatus Hodarchaeales archaeon]